MKVSVCITVFNEEKSISALLDSLLAQTKKPSEIVIVDGGSKDKTVQIIRHYQKKNKKIRFLVEPGSVAHGRNVSIEIARNEIIAHTDAGCVARRDWLEKITRPFRYTEIDIVAGFYKMSAKNSMQRAMNVYHGVPSQRFDPTSFLPSTRSVAFRKKVWEEVGGYSEKLQKAGEDTLFIHQAVSKGFKITRVKDAQVLWRETVSFTFTDSLKKFYQYARGDAQAGVWWHPAKQIATHNIKILAIFIRYLAGLVILIYGLKLLAIIVILYLFWSIFKWRDVVRDWGSRAWLPIIQVSSDFAVMAGFTSGFLKRK